MTLFSVLPLLPLALAAPTSSPSLADLTCTCLHLSRSASPRPCSFLPSTPSTWPAAQSFATEYDIPLHFADRATIARLLAIPLPLPTSVLRTVERGVAAVPRAGPGVDGMVCGFGGEEVGAWGDRFVAQIIAVMMVMIAGYVLAEWAWARATGHRVRLGGGEKMLRV